MNRLTNRYLFPVLSFVVCVLGFGLQAYHLGFYLDDWIILAAYKLRGVSGLMQYAFLGSRPLVFWFWAVGFKLLGLSALNWQLWTLLWRWLASLSLWLVWKELWPERPRETMLAGLLFVVYPIFLQQPTALTFSFHWIGFFLYGLSVYLMLRSVKNPRVYLPLAAVAVLADAAQLFSQEFFTGLELLRPFLLWMVISRQVEGFKPRAKKTLVCWLPYLGLLAAFLVWRLDLMPAPGRDRNTPVILSGLIHQPLTVIPQQGIQVLQDLVESLFGTWYKTYQPGVFSYTPVSNLAAWGAALAALGVLLFAFVKTGLIADKGASPDAAWWKSAAGMGGMALILGMAPGWSIGKHITDTSLLYNDRFGLAAMWGAGLLLVALVTWLGRSARVRTVLLCVLVSLAVGQQFRNTTLYRWSWEDQTRFYWQLKWRAPGLQPPTALLGEGALFTYMGSFANISAVNLMYPQQGEVGLMDTWYFDLNRYDLEQNVAKNLPLSDAKNFLVYSGEAQDSLALQYGSDTSQCLWVVSAEDRYNPLLTERTKQVLPISNLGRILPSEASPLLAAVYGAEPAHDWCYTFQKAQLANQQRDWSQTVQLWQQAASRGIHPHSEPEYVPFIQAFARTGDWDAALALTKKAYFPSYVMHDYLCTTWGSIRADNPASPGLPDALKRLNDEFDCQSILGK